MRRVDAERVEQADHVARHVAEGVGRADRLARQMGLQQLWHVGHAQAFEAGGQSDVTVVEADDAKPARRQRDAELVVPGDHLRRQAHDQHQRRRLRVAKGVVGEFDAVGPGQGRLGARDVQVHV